MPELTMPLAALLLLIVAVLMALGAFFTLTRMLARVKQRLPHGEKVKMFGFDQNTVLKAYTRCFPDGKLNRLYWVFLALMFLSWFLSAWKLGMFR